MTLALLIASLAMGPVMAQSKPPASAAAIEAGGKLVAEKDCASCHIRRFGDAASIYLRPERKVRTPTQLIAQVQYCNAELGAGQFPEDEEHIAAYLNSQYYRVAP
jgi:hypothetical protein